MDMAAHYSKLAEAAKAHGNMELYRELRKKMLQEQYEQYKQRKGV